MDRPGGAADRPAGKQAGDPVRRHAGGADHASGASPGAADDRLLGAAAAEPPPAGGLGAGLGRGRTAVDAAAVAAGARGVPPGELELADTAGMPSAEVLTRLGSGPGGLTSEDAAQRLRQLGPNALGTHRVSAWAVVLRQIRNPILVLLLAAALVSGLTGGSTNALIIAVIVAASVGLGFVNEYRAERAMAALRAQITQEAEVRRDGQVTQLPVMDLVPGDVVALRVGAIVPADLRLLTADDLECDEGVLTGESMPVAKSAGLAVGDEPRDQPGCALMGTVVHQGYGTGVVVTTGARTAFGQIAAGLAEKHGQTAFEMGLSRFSRFLFGVAAILTVGIFAINLALSRPLIDALLFSLAIAVGIAPEMMPAIVTVSLSAGSRALAAKKVLVKRLVAIEDLGNIEILFTDKTGTLTEGAITFERALGPGGDDSSHPLLLGLVCNEAAVSGGAAAGVTRWTARCGRRPRRPRASRPPPMSAWPCCPSIMSGSSPRSW